MKNPPEGGGRADLGRRSAPLAIALILGLHLSVLGLSPAALALELPAVLSPRPESGSPSGHATAAAPNVPVPAGSGEGRRVVYSTAQQRVWLVEQDGSLIGTWLVSGRTGIPYDGSYAVFSRSPWSTARNGRVVMQHMVRFARTSGLPIGFHSIPVSRRSGVPIQSEQELGQPRSAGCVRQRAADAAAMWDFARKGTSVVVISH